MTKHAVLGKFNEIRPGVYREFMKDVAEKVVAAQSHNAHRVVAFEPLAPAALFLRIAITFSAIRVRAPALLHHRNDALQHHFEPLAPAALFPRTRAPLRRCG